jgi:hypothetical protein
LGEVSEWFKVPLSKSGRQKCLVGSNPTLSANLRQGFGRRATVTIRDGDMLRGAAGLAAGRQVGRNWNCIYESGLTLV